MIMSNIKIFILSRSLLQCLALNNLKLKSENLAVKSFVLQADEIQNREFSQITQNFYLGEYEQGLQQLNKLIIHDQLNSNLYSNRALFYSQLQEDEKAINDLEVALSLNPRNYIAYFNLFSVLVRIGHDSIAFQNLCCSLSCLQLIRAKLQKDIKGVEKSLQYCYNNIEAHLLRGLMLFQKSLFKEAIEQFDHVSKIDPNNKQILQLKGLIFAKIMPETINDDKTSDAVEQRNWAYKRLKSSYSVSDDRLQEQIEEKLTQFNQLYLQINGEVGSVTQRVPKSQINSINVSKSRQSNYNENVIVVEDVGQATPHQSQVRPQPGNVYMRMSNMSNMSYKNQMKNTNKENSDIQKLYSIQTEKQVKNDIQNQDLDQFESIIHSKIESEDNQNKKQQIPNKDEKISNNVQISQNKYQNRQQTQIIDITEKQQSHDDKMFESLISQKANQIKENQFDIIEKCNLIYPLDEYVKLKIEVNKMEFSKQNQQLNNSYHNLYCIISYNHLKTKLKTNTAKCTNNICQWNQGFPSATLSQEPSDMKIKVYNKKYDSIRDEFLGEVEVLITTADLLKLPLYNKKGMHLGDIFINLQMVQQLPPPKQIVQPIEQ